jgi:hypothetical protein
VVEIAEPEADWEIRQSRCVELVTEALQGGESGRMIKRMIHASPMGQSNLLNYCPYSYLGDNSLNGRRSLYFQAP